MRQVHERNIFTLERTERFEAVRPYLRRDVIVVARATRTTKVADAESYPGHIEQVAWGLLDSSDDTIVLRLTGPAGAGMPMVAIALSKIIDIKEIGP